MQTETIERPSDGRVDAPVPQGHFQGLDGASIRDEALGLCAELRELGLLEHMAELDIMGLTVIPPEKVGALHLLDDVREALLDMCERRHGVRPDWRGNATHKESGSPFGHHEPFVLMEDPVFQKLMMTRTVLAMASAVVGRNCVISNYQALLKAQGGPLLDLHVDELITPAPFSSLHGGVNITIPITDYRSDNGPTVFVPGSHKLHRPPVGLEGWEQRVPVTAPRGSALIWTGHTWHGAQTGTAPGLRMSVTMFFSRPHMRTMEDYSDSVSPADFERNGPRFATIMGRHIRNYGTKYGGPVLDGKETIIGSTPFN